MAADPSLSLNRSPSQGDFPCFAAGLPTALPGEGEYELRFACSLQELTAIQRLRYRVFNIEMNEGLANSHTRQLDADEFDKQCHHVYVRHRESGDIVGTYRMQTQNMAQAGKGFYSSTEYDLAAMSTALLENIIEIGRACISREHRGLHVLYLLWKGLGQYAAHNQMRYLFGCCSVTTQDQVEGLALLAKLKLEGHMHPDLLVHALPSHRCQVQEQKSISNELSNNIRPPRLMRTYLSLGATICSEPAIDRKFGTIDFLALFDFENLNHSDLAFFKFR